VVGGGQAGLSASWHLKKEASEHLVLDRGNIGDTWRDRWDSFCLVTPNHLCRLPDFAYDGNDPHGFMPRDEIVDYVERFAASFDPPVRNGVEVKSIRLCAGPERYLLDTSIGEYRADNVIIAVGTHQNPNIPDWDRNLSGSITRLHTKSYRNPSQLPKGTVLVIGSGQSGCQVTEDLLAAGRRVHLCVGNAGRLPRRYRGRDILDWDVATGYMTMPVEQHPKGKAVRFLPNAHLTGRDGGHTIDLRRLAVDGVQLQGRVLGGQATTLQIADSLAESLDAADAFCQAEIDGLDEFIAKNGLDAPGEDIQPIHWMPSPQPAELDLNKNGISTIIYATGFYRDFSWIQLPVFEETGYPRYTRGVTELPGFYFVGLHWMHTQGSGLFYGVGDDAAFVTNHLINQAGNQ
ncbi:MAG: flavin-containing monooxygenase, partial [Desulfobulbia bacterium]